MNVFKYIPVFFAGGLIGSLLSKSILFTSQEEFAFRLTLHQLDNIDIAVFIQSGVFIKLALGFFLAGIFSGWHFFCF